MPLTIAAVQCSSTPGDIRRNVARHVALARLAISYGASLVVFPELSLTGYELDLAPTHEVTPGDALLAPIRSLAMLSSVTVVAGGPVAGNDGKRFIGALVFGPTGLQQIYTKVHVHISEQHVFDLGSGGELLQIGGTAVALAVCRDVSIPEHAAAAAASGARVYAAGVMSTEEDYGRKAVLLPQYARSHRMAVLLSNYSGVSGGDESAGKSAFWNEHGSQLAVAPQRGEGVVIATRTGDAWTADFIPATDSEWD